MEGDILETGKDADIDFKGSISVEQNVEHEKQEGEIKAS